MHIAQLINHPTGPNARNRRRTEEKAKVVASVWEEEFSIPCRTGYFAWAAFEEQDEVHQGDLKEKDEFILFFKNRPIGKMASAARN